MAIFVRSGIDILLLDLGGVLIDVDYHRTAQAFNVLGFERFAELYNKAKQDHLFDDFETGALSPTRFRDRIRSLHRSGISDAEIDACWNAMLGSIPQQRIELVGVLRKRYRVLLFSNTNAIHVPAFEEIIRTENGITDFKACFDGAYYSCEVGLRKPDAEAFHYILAKHGVEPQCALFIDDSLQHVLGAHGAGLNAEHLDLEREDFGKLVDRLGLLG